MAGRIRAVPGPAFQRGLTLLLGLPGRVTAPDAAAAGLAGPARTAADRTGRHRIPRALLVRNGRSRRRTGADPVARDPRIPLPEPVCPSPAARYPPAADRIRAPARQSPLRSSAPGPPIRQVPARRYGPAPALPVATELAVPAGSAAAVMVLAPARALPDHTVLPPARMSALPTRQGIPLPGFARRRQTRTRLVEPRVRSG
jgi:hypothetical protein